MDTKRHHLYHAEATAISGHLTQPLPVSIHPQASVKLREQGGYLSQHSDGYRAEQVLRYQTAYTQVAGNDDSKPELGWSTLSTSVVEGLNVLDVLTCDRVVMQMSSNHLPEGYVPRVSFLGSRFENLRINGHPVQLDFDPDMLGPKPANDQSFASDPGFMERVKSQRSRILEAKDIPAEIAGRYNQGPKVSQQTESGRQESIECSLVNRAEVGSHGRCHGHVIDVPDFGKIYLGVLRVEHSDYKEGTETPKKTLLRLTMIECKFGCAIAGNASMAMGITNGGTKP